MTKLSCIICDKHHVKEKPRLGKDGRPLLNKPKLDLCKKRLARIFFNMHLSLTLFGLGVRTWNFHQIRTCLVCRILCLYVILIIFIKVTSIFKQSLDNQYQYPKNTCPRSFHEKYNGHHYFLSWRESWTKFEDWDWFNARNYCRWVLACCFCHKEKTVTLTAIFCYIVCLGVLEDLESLLETMICPKKKKMS